MKEWRKKRTKAVYHRSQARESITPLNTGHKGRANYIILRLLCYLPFTTAPPHCNSCTKHWEHFSVHWSTLLDFLIFGEYVKLAKNMYFPQKTTQNSLFTWILCQTTQTEGRNIALISTVVYSLTLELVLSCLSAGGSYHFTKVHPSNLRQSEVSLK